MTQRLLLGILTLGLTLSLAHAQQTPEQRFFLAMADAPQGKTKEAGGDGGKAFQEVFPEGGILVGFDVWEGEYAGTLVVHALCPIYQTLAGRQRGTVHGDKRGGKLVTVEAPEGNAVTGLHIRTGSVVDGLQLMYQKIDYFGYKLTASSSSKSEAVGGEGGKRRSMPLNTNGKPVVGIYGADGLAVDRIGLIYSDK